MGDKTEAWLYYTRYDAERSLSSLKDEGWMVNRNKLTAVRNGEEIQLFAIHSEHDVDRLRGREFSAVKVKDERVPLEARQIALLLVR